MLHSWNVRQAESFAAAAKKSASQDKATKPASKKVDVHKATEKRVKTVGDYLKTPVKVQHTAKGGKLVISFTSEEDLARIVDRISN
jgi:ParB-like chromosome segregation protein Spo0J